MTDEPSQSEVERLIREMGLPTETPEMLAGQILKRARQLAEKRGLTVRESLDQLVALLQQGWTHKKNQT